MRKLILMVPIMLILCAPLTIATVQFRKWDVAQNRGYTFGYWADANRLASAVVRIPDVALSNIQANQDVVLKEIVIEVATPKSPELKLWIAHNDPIRDMSEDEMVEELKQRIASMEATTTDI